MELINATLPAKKTIALVAHDNKKPALVNWLKKHQSLLAEHHLCGTGTTGKMIAQTLNVPVHQYLSGPLGGDQQIGSKIAEGEIHCLIFFWDPFEAMPHEPDVKALLRLATAWNIPIANNTASADMLISSPLFNQTLNRDIPDYGRYMVGR